MESKLSPRQKYADFIVDIHNKKRINLIDMYTSQEVEKLNDYYIRLKLSREKIKFMAESALETRCRTHLGVNVPEGVLPCFSRLLTTKINIV
jgi:hypothetical protein